MWDFSKHDKQKDFQGRKECNLMTRVGENFQKYRESQLKQGTCALLLGLRKNEVHDPAMMLLTISILYKHCSF